MSIEKTGAGLSPASTGGTEANEKGRKSGKGYSSASEGVKTSAEATGAKPKRLSLKGSRSRESAEQAQANTQNNTSNDESPDMVYDQLMVLLQQALHEVPASLAAKEKRKR